MVQGAGSFVFGLALARQISGLLAQVAVELNRIGTQNGHFLEVCCQNLLLGLVAGTPPLVVSTSTMITLTVPSRHTLGFQDVRKGRAVSVS